MNLSMFWRTVAAKILAALLAVAVVSILISVVSVSLRARSTLISEVEKRNLEIARQASRQMSRYVEDSREILASMGTFLAPLPWVPWVRDTVLASLALDFPRFAWIAVLAPDGSIISDGRRVGAQPPAFDDATMASIRRDKTVVSPVAIGSDYTPYVMISTPTSAAARHGWLVAELHLRSTWDLVDSVTIGGKHVAFLVAGSGKLIAHYDKVRVIAGEQFAPPPRDLPAESDWRIERGKNGTEYLSAYSRVEVEGLDWDVGVQQPLSDALLPASVLVRWALLLGLAGAAVSGVLGLLLSRAISAPFVRLMEGTKLISAGRLDHRLEIAGGEELRRLADSFNGMVESLQERSRQLAESERQYRLLTERVNDIIFLLDDRGVLVFVSPRLQELTGFPASVAVGRRLIDVLPDDDRGRYAPMVRDLLSTDERITREAQFEFTTPDGRRLVLEGRFTGETAPDGRRQVYGVARDVSERARLMEQLAQAQKMEAVGRLAGGIAHDFNNLLTAIIGYCDYSLLDLNDTALVQKNFEEIMKAGGRAAGLTQQLLAFSRRQAAKPRVIELNVLISNLGRLLNRLLGEDVALETHLHPQPCHVLADAGQLEQVVMNLCINARDALPRGGRIVVSTSARTIDAATAEPRYAALRGEFVCLRVADNGTGMDAATRAHLFEPFFTTKDVGKGTGLGLSTVYGIVQQAHGAIFADSEPDKGTTFEVLFPAASPAVTAEPAPASPTGLRGGTETVLLVEDEVAIRSLVRNVLSSHGYTVLEAENGEKALEIFGACEETVDIVVTDVVLPGVGGPDIVAGMTALRPSVRALYMSGYTGDVVTSHGAQAAGLSFLQKPFSPETLLRRVRDVLDAVGGS